MHVWLTGAVQRGFPLKEERKAGRQGGREERRKAGREGEREERKKAEREGEREERKKAGRQAVCLLHTHGSSMQRPISAPFLVQARLQKQRGGGGGQTNAPK
jgi:hypothetical protein